jgi:dolichyl-phosphate-mannose--protein O-mannosyl transferase
MVNLISHLTTDKDEQQELWVRYLENSDASILSEYLVQIREQYSEEQLLQVTVWHHLENPSDFNLQWLFDHFTDLEQSVIQLLILGVELQTIGCIKNIGLMRLRHVVSIIRENKAWEELNEFKD